MPWITRASTVGEEKAHFDLIEAMIALKLKGADSVDQLTAHQRHVLKDHSLVLTPRKRSQRQQHGG